MLYFCAASSGNWSDNISVGIKPATPEGIDVNDERVYDPHQFIVNVYVGRNQAARPVESFIVSRQYELNGDGDQMFVEDVINTHSQYIRVRNNLDESDHREDVHRRSRLTYTRILLA